MYFVYYEEFKESIGNWVKSFTKFTTMEEALMAYSAVVLSEGEVYIGKLYKPEIALTVLAEGHGITRNF